MLNDTHHTGLSKFDIKIARYSLPSNYRGTYKEDEEAKQYGSDPSSGQTWFSEKYQLKNVPTFILIKKAKPFYFSNANDINRLISHTSRIIQPVQALESLRMVDEFLEEIVEDMSGRKIVRVKVVLLIAKGERDDFDEAIKGFYRAAEIMHWREDVVFGEVYSASVIKDVYNKYHTKLFAGSHDLNSIVVWRNYNRFEYKSDREGLVVKMDLEKLGGQGKDSFGRWIAENSVGLVEEMNSLN